eukprot:5309716-Prymnesium_polylepis.1
MAMSTPVRPNASKRTPRAHARPAPRSRAPRFPATGQAEVFGAMGAALAADPALGKKVNGCIQFNLTAASADADWFVDCKASVAKSGKADKADCTITISEAGTPVP